MVHGDLILLSIDQIRLYNECLLTKQVHHPPTYKGIGTLLLFTLSLSSLISPLSDIKDQRWDLGTSLKIDVSPTMLQQNALPL